MHSIKIVGYDIRSSIELKGCVRAINKAICQANDIKKLIHHSESGQYCSTTYTQILHKNNIQISMIEDNRYYENAQAERINGILKNKFYLDQNFKDLANAKRAAKNAIKLYNEIRLNLFLDYQTTSMVNQNAA